jgi:hypothetical protein
MKKFYVALIGGTVLLLGLAMLILPGPGVLVMAAGVAILATEFLWARRAWRKAQGAVARARRKSGLRGWLRRIGGRVKVSRPREQLGSGEPPA